MPDGSGPLVAEAAQPVCRVPASRLPTAGSYASRPSGPGMQTPPAWSGLAGPALVPGGLARHLAPLGQCQAAPQGPRDCCLHAPSRGGRRTPEYLRDQAAPSFSASKFKFPEQQGESPGKILLLEFGFFGRGEEGGKDLPSGGRVVAGTGRLGGPTPGPPRWGRGFPLAVTRRRHSLLPHLLSCPPPGLLGSPDPCRCEFGAGQGWGQHTLTGT